MYIIDSHCDTITTLPLHPLVSPYNFSRRCPQLQFTAVFTADEGVSPEDSHRLTWEYIRLFRKALEKDIRITQVRTCREIDTALESGLHAALLTLESGTPLLGDPANLRAFYEAGVRVVGLTWLTNDLAKSNRLAEGEGDTGLTSLGRKIVEEGNRLGIIFDVSHASDHTFWDLAEASEKPIVATHSNFRALCPHSRNLTDGMALEIFRQGGMVGLNLCTKFISEDKKEQTAETLFRHLDHGMALGGEDCIGFGCDIDGIGGVYPSPLHEGESIHDRLIELMLRRGYGDGLVRKVAGENWMRYLRENL